MENAEFVQKFYFDEQEQKPAEFNRVEFATKNLVTRIQNTQSFFHCASNENPHISLEDFWLAALADVIVCSLPPKADNDEFLEQLKIAERQLGLSAQKVKRILCQTQLLNVITMAAGGIITVFSLSSIVYVMATFDAKTALSLMFITGLLILAGLGVFMTAKAINAYKHDKSKIRDIDRQTKAFLQKKHRPLNQAEIFILRRVKAVLPELALQ